MHIFDLPTSPSDGCGGLSGVIGESNVAGVRCKLKWGLLYLGSTTIFCNKAFLQ